MNYIEKLMLDVVKSYYNREYADAKRLIVYLETVPEFQRFRESRWWKRFMIDFTTWEKEVA